MSTQRLDKHSSPIDYAALMDAAQRRALEARREALDEFWSALGRGIGAAWRSLGRAVARSRAGLMQRRSAHFSAKR